MGAQPARTKRSAHALYRARRLRRDGNGRHVETSGAVEGVSRRGLCGLSRVALPLNSAIAVSRRVLRLHLCLPQILSAWPEGPNRAMILPMRALLNLIRWMLLGLVRSRTSLEATSRKDLRWNRKHKPENPRLVWRLSEALLCTLFNIAHVSASSSADRPFKN